MTEPYQLHADDPMGAAAHNAAILASGLDYRLLGASSKDLDRETRAELLRKALQQWPILCRAMSALQEAAPNIARQAQRRDEDLKDFVESRNAP
jgi:hypothetical protein